jgi:ABC-type phosphate transport system permease subunit
LHGLSASGHFPREHRAPALRSPLGTVILHGTILIALTSLIAGLWAAWRLIPWYAAVIAGGLAILATPVVLQKFSDSFVHDRGSLLSFAGASVALAIMLLWLATSRVMLW